MSVVAPVTVAWQRVNLGSTGNAKEIETFTSLENAINRARDVITQTEDSNNNSFTGTNPQAHITLHPGDFAYGNSLSSNDLEDIFITFLPGAVATDATSTFPPDQTTNIADINAFAGRVFFASATQEFIFSDDVVFQAGFDFQDDVLTFDLQSAVEGGIRVEQSGTGSSFLYNVSNGQWTLDDDIDVQGQLTAGTFTVTDTFSVNTTSDITLETDGNFGVTADTLSFDIANAATQNFGSVDTNVTNLYDVSSGTFSISAAQDGTVEAQSGLLQLIGNNAELESTSGNVELFSANNLSFTGGDSLFDVDNFTVQATSTIDLDATDWTLDVDTATATIADEFVINGSTSNAEFTVNVPTNLGGQINLTGNVVLNDLTVNGVFLTDSPQVTIQSDDFITLDAVNTVNVLAPDINLTGTFIDILATNTLSLLSNNNVIIDANNQSGTGTSVVDIFADEITLDPTGSVIVESPSTFNGDLTVSTGNFLQAQGDADVVGNLTAGTITPDGLTSQRVTFIGSAGEITDASGFTFDSSTSILSVPEIESTTGDFGTVEAGTLAFDTAGTATEIPASVDSNSPSSTALVSEQALVDFVGTSVSAGVSVSDDGTQVVNESTDINFRNILAVTDDGDSTTTIDLEQSFINRVEDLENLLPTAPAVQEINGLSGQSAKLSFGSSNTITGVTNVPGEDVNDVFAPSGNRRGVVGDTGVTVDGRINPNVSSTDNHDAQIFGDAETGVLKLIVNGSELTGVEADLDSTSSAINTVTNGTGFDLSAADPLTFADGSNFTSESQRSGTWQVDQADLQSGYNEILVRHEDDTGTLLGETQVITYVLDDDTDATGLANEVLDSFNGSGARFLSGVEYFTSATGSYSITISNIYKNTYATGNAIRYTTTNTNLADQNIPELSGSQDETKIINLNKQPSVSQDRLFGGGMSVSVEVLDPINSDVTSSGATNFDILLDQAPNLETDLKNAFTRETYRFPSNKNFDNNLGNNQWDSTKELFDTGDLGYNNGLQVVRGNLEYPNEDFSQYVNAPSGNPDYTSGVSGKRNYFGFFTDPTGTSSFALTVLGNGTLVNTGNESAGTDQVSISIKLPGLTGWLDVNKDFETGQLSDGDGAFFESNGANQFIGSGSNIGLTTGATNTSNSFDKLYYRVISAENWTGNITEMSIDWAV